MGEPIGLSIDELSNGPGESSFGHFVSQHRDSRVARRAKDIGLYVFGLLSAFVMGEVQEGILVGVADILFIAEYSPQHSNQFRPVPLHGGQYPSLALVNRLSDGKVPRQAITDRLIEHNHLS